MLKFLRGSRRTAGIWWLIIFGTAVTFIIGFSVAPNIGGGRQATASATLGSVNGRPVTVADFQRTYNQLESNYRTQFNKDPQGRDLALLHEQAWVQLVTETAILEEAEKQGLGVTDDEVLFSVRNSPPPWVRTQASFQTNGQFDPRKYQQALTDPSVNWSPLEDEMRRMLPGQKLEANLLSTVKFSEPELRRAFSEQFDKAAVTVARWNPALGPIDTTGFTDAALRAYYDKNVGRFSGPARAQAIVVRVPRTLRPEDQKATLNQARELVTQARGGADFAQLARDHSDDPTAANGGDLGQNIHLSQVSGELKPKMAAVVDSAIIDPQFQGNRYFILKVVRVSGGTEPTYRARQIVLTVQQSEEGKQDDAAKIRRLREQAAKRGLGPAAAAMGWAGQETGWFGQQTMVSQLLDLPQGQQFAMIAEKGALSPTYDLGPQFAILQVKAREPAGPRPFEEARAEVRAAMEIEARLVGPSAAAERALAQIRAGKPFEEATKAEGATSVEKTPLFTRAQPASSMAGSGRAIGLAFGLPIGQVGGPVQAPNAILLVRKDDAQTAGPASYDTLKSRVSQSLLQNRQNRTFSAWLDGLREQARVVDRRGEVLEAQ